MTRQKKEIIKKIREIEIEIAVDEELSHGCHPPNAYDCYYDAIHELEEQLARLSHYENAWEMLNDPRGYTVPPEMEFFS